MASMVSGARTGADAVYAALRSRRSVRLYQERDIPEELLKRVLDAGTWAPSGKNVQNWVFFVLTGEIRNRYLELNKKAWEKVRPTLERRLKPSLLEFTERFFYTLGNAPAFILAYAERLGVNHPQTEIGNVYLALQNILIAAQAEGLGSCLLGTPLEIEPDITDFMKNQGVQHIDTLKLVSGLTLGFPAHQPPAAERRAERIIWLR